MNERDIAAIELFAAFKKELKQLLAKYDAGIEVEIPQGRSYAMLRANIKTPGGHYSDILTEDYLVKAKDL